MTKVLIAHSCPGMCVGLQGALARVQGIEVVATASQGEEALQLTRRLRAYVVLLDCRLSGALDGIAVAERIHPAGWRARLLALSAPGHNESVYRMWQAGAAGCISERAELKSIAKAVEATARGKRLWTPEQIACVGTWWDEVGSKIEALTRREREVLVLVAEGLTDRRIAQRLWISENTVHTHVRRVLGKLGLTTRQEAIVFAFRKAKWPRNHQS